MTRTSEITRAATALRTRTAAVPGFCPDLARLLEACADDPGEAGKHARAVAEAVLAPTKHRTEERNETMQNPATAAKGDRIEHDLVPGFTMTVEDVAPCGTDGSRSEPHQQYQVTDPEGATDWLCAFDVVLVPAEGDEVSNHA